MAQWQVEICPNVDPRLPIPIKLRYTNFEMEYWRPDDVFPTEHDYCRYQKKSLVRA